MSEKSDPGARVREIHRRTRRRFSSEEKIRIVLEGLKGEETIAELCRREGISPNLYYTWSREFLEAGKRAVADGLQLLQGGGLGVGRRTCRSCWTRRSPRRGWSG